MGKKVSNPPPPRQTDKKPGQQGITEGANPSAPVSLKPPPPPSPPPPPKEDR